MVVLVEVQSQALLPDDVDVDDHVGVAVVVAAAAAAVGDGAAGAVAGQTRLFLHSVETTGCFFLFSEKKISSVFDYFWGFEIFEIAVGFDFYIVFLSFLA